MDALLLRVGYPHAHVRTEISAFQIKQQSNDGRRAPAVHVSAPLHIRIQLRSSPELMQQALQNLNEEVQRAVWSGTPRYSQWRIAQPALKEVRLELRQLVRVPRIEVLHGSPCMLICADHHGCHTQRHELLLPERRAAL